MSDIEVVEFVGGPWDGKRRGIQSDNLPVVVASHQGDGVVSKHFYDRKAGKPSVYLYWTGKEKS